MNVIEDEDGEERKKAGWLMGWMDGCWVGRNTRIITTTCFVANNTVKSTLFCNDAAEHRQKTLS